MANLTFLRVWQSLLTYSGPDTNWMKAPPPRGAYVAAMVNVLLVAALVLGLIVVARRGRRIYSGLARLGLLGAVVVLLRAFLEVVLTQVPWIGKPLEGLLQAAGPAMFPGFLALLAAALVWRRALTRAGSAALLILFPLAPITFLNAARMLIVWDPAPFGDLPLAAPVAKPASASRILWVIFDAWDQDLIFSQRPPGVALPELDAFQARSLCAVNAYPPSGETLQTAPALTSGRLVRRAEQRDARTLLITFEGQSEPVAWGTPPNVFSQARAAGLNTAVAGWAHCYCRALARDLTACHWEALSLPSNSMGESFLEILLNQNRSHFETHFRSVWGRSLSAIAHGRAYTAIMERALRYSADPALGFVLVHLPIPHPPFIYNRASGRFDLRRPFLFGALTAFHEGYLDALDLADRSLGDLRESMQRAGVWENTTILLSSDHSHRTSRAFTGLSERGRRVPFLLKLAGQGQGLLYEKEFNTVLSSGLLLAVLRGEVSTVTAAAAWLDRHRTVGRSPYEE